MCVQPAIHLHPISKRLPTKYQGTVIHTAVIVAVTQTSNGQEKHTTTVPLLPLHKQGMPIRTVAIVTLIQANTAAANNNNYE
jgi:hypothetical protein